MGDCSATTLHESYVLCLTVLRAECLRLAKGRILDGFAVVTYAKRVNREYRGNPAPSFPCDEVIGDLANTENAIDNLSLVSSVTHVAVAELPYFG